MAIEKKIQKSKKKADPCVENKGAISWRLCSVSIILFLLFFNVILAIFNFYQQREIKKILEDNIIQNTASNPIHLNEISGSSSGFLSLITAHLPSNLDAQMNLDEMTITGDVPAEFKMAEMVDVVVEKENKAVTTKHVTGEKVNEEKIIDNPKEGYIASSFGDSFSSLAWINSEETDLTFDSLTTSFYFPPKVSYTKIKDCSSPEECPIELNSPACRGSECLEVRDGKLLLNGKKISWPNSEFSKARVSVGILEKKWLVGAVIGDSKDEKIMVYSFDGKNFSPVLGVDEIIKPQYEKAEGVISFGGVDNDFLVLYLGYSGLAYHVRGGSMENISQYFNIRVSEGGYPAKITRVADAADVFWYISSQKINKFKLIKLWQNGKDSIEGAADLFSHIFDSWKPGLIDLSYIGKTSKGREFKINLDYGAEYPRVQGTLIDNGFDNSIDRKVHSNNLITSNNYLLGFVKAADIRLNLGFGKNSSDDWRDYSSFQFSNNGSKWLDVSSGEEIVFPNKKGKELYWRATLKKSNNKEYSPFLIALII